MRGKLMFWGTLALLGCGEGADEPGATAPGGGDVSDGTSEQGGDDAYPPIDGTLKYFKPGPPLATPDEAELLRRYDYHQRVIDAHGYGYTLRELDLNRRELTTLAGFQRPSDVAESKPLKSGRRLGDPQLPEKWDTREHGVGLPPVRDQGGCGSCWAFGTVGAVEAAVAMADRQIVDLSEQFVLDCSNEGTCGGGYWAYSLFERKGGVLESAQPYQAWDRQCRDPGAYVYKIESSHGVDGGNREQMKAAILRYGSVAVTMSVCGSIPGYGGGVYDSTECNRYGTNHIVTLVGWDDTRATRFGRGVWILRNSWGRGWGEDGYGYFAYDTANLAEDPTYVVYKPEDPTNTDGDAFTDLHDNCKDVRNDDQKDLDLDGQGDACDARFDGFERPLQLGDDDSRRFDLGFAFPFFGTRSSELNVNSDGNLTFGASDAGTVERTEARFLTGAPRIAALYTDLNPGAGGQIVFGKATPDSAFVRYDRVRRFDGRGEGTVTVTLRPDGSIAMAFGAVSGSGYLVGVSRGGAGNAGGATDLSPGRIAFGAGSATGAAYQNFGGGAAFDLANTTVTFSPGNAPAPPSPGPPGPPQPPAPPAAVETALVLGDDTSAPVPMGFQFPFFGRTYDSVNVNADGNLTFGSADAGTAARDLNRFLNGAPRIAALLADLDPSRGGTVTWQATRGVLTIRYKAVRRFGSQGTVTATVVLKANGRVELTYGQVANGAALVGLSRGGAGNTSQERRFAQLANPVPYGGRQSLHQAFGEGAPFELTGRTVIFTTDAIKPPPPVPHAADGSEIEDAAQDVYLSLGDDGSAEVALGFEFPFFGQLHDTVFVNGDGNLTFGRGDGQTARRDEARLLGGPPRIGLLYADLDPSAGGTVSHRKDGDDAIVFSFTAVPLWSADGANTARVRLDADGTITFSYEGLSLQSALIGVSRGGAGNGGRRMGLADLLSGPRRFSRDGALFAPCSEGEAIGLGGRSVVLVP